MTLQGTGEKIQTWFQKPETKERLASLRDVAGHLAINIVAAVIDQYATNGKADGWGALATAGANTLYQSASALRQIQGTNEVIDPEAMAAVLRSNGTQEDMARQIAAILSPGIAQLAAQGISPDRINESIANEWDTQAAAVLNK